MVRNPSRYSDTHCLKLLLRRFDDSCLMKVIIVSSKRCNKILNNCGGRERNKSMVSLEHVYEHKLTDHYFLHV